MKLLIILLLLTSSVFADNKKVTMSVEGLSFEGKNYISINLENEKGWHTYWKNPGDAGIPVKFNFSVNSNSLELIPLEWPAPKRFIEPGDVLAYGYDGDYSFFFEIPKELEKKIFGQEIQVKGEWLVCENVCIPGEDSKKVKYQNVSFVEGRKRGSTELIKRLESLPKVGEIKDLEIYLSKGNEDNTLLLNYTLSNISSDVFNFKANLLTPFLNSPFDYKHEELFYDQSSKTIFGKIRIDWDGIYNEPPYPLPLDGVFRKEINAKFLFQYQENTNPIIVSKTFNEFSLTGTSQLEAFLKSLEPIAQDKIVKVGNGKSNETNLFLFLILAFLGGLILNLMPCVLPVISLKLFGLIAHQNESKKSILRHNTFYSLGVFFTFFILATVVVVLKMSGEKVGWGFQLQSPIFVFIMMVVLLIMAINMFGLFEFRTPFGNSLGNKNFKNNYVSDFFNGVLATILSTPCSAPFLGAALTFAFTTSYFNIYLTLSFVALGLSFPFLLTGFYPKAISFLPKPGMWMEKLKYFLGLSLLLTFVWLYDVLMNLIDFEAFGIYLNTLFILIFFYFFFRKFISKNVFMSFVLLVFPFALTTLVYSQNGFKVSSRESTIVNKGSVNWQPWSEAKLAELKTSKSLVFIDFTAKWCLTCKVNKKLVLDTLEFSDFVKKHNIETLLGDWTKKDDNITKFLERYNVVGVPAYFVQRENGEIIFLGETVSIQKIKEALKI